MAKATKRRKSEKAEKLRMGIFEFQLHYKNGTPSHEVVIVPGEGEGIALDYPNPKVIPIELRAVTFLGMLNLAAHQPDEFIALTDALRVDGTEVESVEEILDWAEFHEEEISNSVAWWNETYPDLIIPVTPYRPPVEWPAVLFLLTGVGAAGTATMAVLKEIDRER